MTTLSERNPDTQERAIEIVADALRVLRTRDGIAVPDDLIAERARNAVTALVGEFELVLRIPPTADTHLATTQETDAAVAVAALLADPFDRDARAEARAWLTTWKTAQTDRRSTSTAKGAAVRS